MIVVMADNKSVQSSLEIPEQLTEVHSLVIQLVSQGRHEEAEAKCNQEIDNLEKSSGHDKSDVVTMLNILGWVYRNQKRHKEAGDILIKTMAIIKKTPGENYPALAKLNMKIWRQQLVSRGL